LLMSVLQASFPCSSRLYSVQESVKHLPMSSTGLRDALVFHHSSED
jgi:hypothetical protein